MVFTSVDTSLSRFSQFNLTLVYPKVFNVGDLQAASRALLRQFPILGSQLSRWRTHTTEPQRARLLIIWADRHVCSILQDLVAVSVLAVAGINVQQLDSLFTFSNTHTDPSGAQVLRIQTVFLLNATVVRFVCQHPLGGSYGVYAIARSYCDLMNGKSIPRDSFERLPFVPKHQIQRWVADVKEKELQYAQSDMSVQEFTLKVNIRNQLESRTGIGNHMILVPVDVNETYRKNDFTLPDSPEIAVEVRRTIREARRPGSMSEFLAFYDSFNQAPIVPRWLGLDDPQVTVSFWTRQPLFDLDTMDTKPCLAYPGLDTWSWLRTIGIGMDDLIITWVAYTDGRRNGFWIQGNLSGDVWDRMANAVMPPDTK
ncbi:hypothetical protein BDW69DRAFT_188053 [Aspergillus filifer]